MKNEPGNHRYELFRSTSDPTSFLAFEVYTDQAAVDAHMATDYLKAGFPVLRGLLAGRPETKIFHDQ